MEAADLYLQGWERQDLRGNLDMSKDKRWSCQTKPISCNRQTAAFLPTSPITASPPSTFSKFVSLALPSVHSQIMSLLSSKSYKVSHLAPRKSQPFLFFPSLSPSHSFPSLSLTLKHSPLSPPSSSSSHTHSCSSHLISHCSSSLRAFRPHLATEFPADPFSQPSHSCPL
jgi:hypothetical protein